MVNYSYGGKLLNHVISIQVHVICLLKKSTCNMTSMRCKLGKMHPNTDLLVKFRYYSIKNTSNRRYLWEISDNNVLLY